MDMIPVCEPLLCGNELKYVTEAISTGWISSSGPYISKFETEFARYCGARFAVTTTNGTTALHLACAALGLGPGDEVIIPDFTMIASAFAVCYTGAKPVFVDAEPETWNLNVDLIEAKITPRTRAIMPVHIYGHPCRMDKIREIANRHGIKVIEDAAEAHGAELNGKKCGTLGDINCFSLFGNKIITTGEGGIITTDDQALYDRCRYLKNLSFPLNGPREYIHQDIGFNYRMPNTIAAIGLAQLENINKFIEARRNNARLYKERLKNISGIVTQPEKAGAKNVYWMFGVLVQPEYGRSRDELMSHLKENQIESRKFFYPMHRQPALLKFGCQEGDFPVSDQLSATGLYLPSGSGLNEAQIDRVCSVIEKFKR